VHETVTAGRSPAAETSLIKKNRQIKIFKISANEFLFKSAEEDFSNGYIV